MARSTRTAPAPAVATPAAPVAVDPKAPPPLVNDAVIEAVRWNDPEAVAAFMRNIGSQMSTAGVWANYVTAMWRIGSTAKATGNQLPTEAVAAAFTAYRAARATVAKAMTDNTAVTYSSVAQTIAKAAYELPYDGTHILRYLQNDVGSVAWSQRGARINDVLKAFPHEPTSYEAVRDHFKAPAAKSNMTDEATAIVKAVTDWLQDADLTPVIRASLTPEYKALHDAAIAFQSASAKVVAPTPVQRRGKAISDDAKAIMDAIAGKAPVAVPTTH